MLDDLADYVQLLLQLGSIHVMGAAPDEHLRYVRAYGTSVAAHLGLIQRNVAPAEQLQPFVLDNPGNVVLHLLLRGRLGRHEHHAHTVCAFQRKLQAQRAAFAPEKLVGRLYQNPSSVPGLRVAPASAPVSEVDQDLKPLFNDPVRLMALYIGDNADAATIVFRFR